jgi:hypothetical protein
MDIDMRRLLKAFLVRYRSIIMHFNAKNDFFLEKGVEGFQETDLYV